MSTVNVFRHFRSKRWSEVASWHRQTTSTSYSFSSKLVEFVQKRREGYTGLFSGITSRSFTSGEGSTGIPGSGVGKSGGGGGAIREAGGVFGKLEAAREEEYFYKLEKRQIRLMREELESKLRSKIDAKQPLTHEEQATWEHLKKLNEIEKRRG